VGRSHKKLQNIENMSYIARIELNSNILTDFALLHQAMSNNGFSQTIRASDGKDYYLPKATYLTTSTSTRSQVLESAKQAVSQTKRTAEILVVEYSGCSFSGLKSVK